MSETTMRFVRYWAATTLPAILMLPAAAATYDLDVALTQPLDSRTAKPGQAVSARLLHDLRAGKALVAPRGSSLRGHVTEVVKARRLLHAELSPQRWLRAGGGICLQFDEIVVAGRRPIKIHALPESVIGPNGHEQAKGSDLTVEEKSKAIASSRKPDLKPKAARTALGVAAIVGAPFTAVVGGVAGAVKPSTVLPAADSAAGQKHRRLKGLATGFVAGLPGGFLVDDAILKGRASHLPSGTHLRLKCDHIDNL